VSAWLARAAVVLFLVSWVVPAARIGPPDDRPAIGVAAALFSSFLLPLAARMLVDPSPTNPVPRGDALYALVAGAYFAMLLCANGVMLYGLMATATGRVRRARRLATIAALLVWVALFLDYQRLYRALTLADGEAFELRVGFFLWAASFVLLAIALHARSASVSSSGATA
jgi:hypothetical protein